MTTKHNRTPGSCYRMVVLLITWSVIATGLLQAQKSAPTANQVKSAYLYNFGKFVEWPANSSSSEEYFNICVLGDEAFGSTLETTIAQESIKGQKVLVKRIAKAQEAPGCRILFISVSQQGHLKEILTELDNTSILTVSDMPEFARLGGMIQFVVQANKVRFEVNLTSAERTGLTLSSQLLQVAVAVKRSTQSGG
jgi:hypothetical protein